MFCFLFLFFPKQCSELCELKNPTKAESSRVALQYLGFDCEVALTEMQRVAHARPGSVTKAELPASCICHPQRELATLFYINTGYYSNTELLFFAQVYYVGAKERVQTLHAFTAPLQGTSHALVNC